MKLNIRGPVPPDEGASSSASPSGEGSSVSKEKAPEHSSNSGSIDEDISAPEVTQEQEGTTATTTVGETEPMDIDDLPVNTVEDRQDIRRLLRSYLQTTKPNCCARLKR